MQSLEGEYPDCVAVRCVPPGRSPFHARVAKRRKVPQKVPASSEVTKKGLGWCYTRSLSVSCRRWCCRHGNDGDHLVCIYEDRSFFIWDIEDPSRIRYHFSFLAHSQTIWDVKAVPYCPEAALPEDTFVTCSADSTIRFWYARALSPAAAQSVPSVALRRAPVLLWMFAAMCANNVRVLMAHGTAFEEKAVPFAVVLGGVPKTNISGAGNAGSGLAVPRACQNLGNFWQVKFIWFWKVKFPLLQQSYCRKIPHCETLGPWWGIMGNIPPYPQYPLVWQTGVLWHWPAHRPLLGSGMLSSDWGARHWGNAPQACGHGW